MTRGFRRCKVYNDPIDYGGAETIHLVPGEVCGLIALTNIHFGFV